jgi:hypothetical protein
MDSSVTTQRPGNTLNKVVGWMLLAGWVLTAGLLVLLAYRDSDSVDADHPARKPKSPRPALRPTGGKLGAGNSPRSFFPTLTSGALHVTQQDVSRDAQTTDQSPDHLEAQAAAP